MKSYAVVIRGRLPFGTKRAGATWKSRLTLARDWMQFTHSAFQTLKTRVNRWGRGVVRRDREEIQREREREREKDDREKTV